MLNTPSMAIILEHGSRPKVIVEDWPSNVPLPDITSVDYNTSGRDREEIQSFPVGEYLHEAVCSPVIASLYDPFDGPALSPRTVREASLAGPDDALHFVRDDAPDPDYETQFLACIQAMVDESHGQIRAFSRDAGGLRMTQIAASELLHVGAQRFEMVLFEGSNAQGVRWTHFFFPIRRKHSFA